MGDNGGHNLMEITPRLSENNGSLSEKQLVQQTVTLLPDFLRDYELEWSFEREVGVGRAIADVVVLLKSKRDRAAPPELLTIAESVILASLRRSGRTRIDLLEKRCGVRREGLRDGLLDRLKRWGLVTHGRGGLVELSTTLTDQYQIIALEAKLFRWRDALNQARSYQRYADRSYVVLPEAVAERALKHKGEFVSNGIGLLSVSEQRLDVLLEAGQCTSHDWRREFVYSRLMASQEG